MSIYFFVVVFLKDIQRTLRGLQIMHLGLFSAFFAEGHCREVDADSILERKYHLLMLYSPIYCSD